IVKVAVESGVLMEPARLTAPSTARRTSSRNTHRSLWHGLPTVSLRRTEGLKVSRETFGPPSGRVRRPAHNRSSPWRCVRWADRARESGAGTRVGQLQFVLALR